MASLSRFIGAFRFAAGCLLACRFPPRRGTPGPAYGENVYCVCQDRPPSLVITIRWR